MLFLISSPPSKGSCRLVNASTVLFATLTLQARESSGSFHKHMYKLKCTKAERTVLMIRLSAGPAIIVCLFMVCPSNLSPWQLSREEKMLHTRADQTAALVRHNHRTVCHIRSWLLPWPIYDFHLKAIQYEKVLLMYPNYALQRSYTSNNGKQDNKNRPENGKRYLIWNRKTNLIAIIIVKYTAVSQSKRNALSSHSALSNFKGEKIIHLKHIQKQLKVCHQHRKLKSGKTHEGWQQRLVCPGQV